jgi:hypothetical protein
MVGGNNRRSHGHKRRQVRDCSRNGPLGCWLVEVRWAVAPSRFSRWGRQFYEADALVDFRGTGAGRRLPSILLEVVHISWRSDCIRRSPSLCGSDLLRRRAVGTGRCICTDGSCCGSLLVCVCCLTCQSTRTHNSRRRLRRSCWWSGHFYVKSQNEARLRLRGAGDAGSVGVRSDNEGRLRLI